MPEKQRLLTKSAYLAGLRCDKLLWSRQNQRVWRTLTKPIPTRIQSIIRFWASIWAQPVPICGNQLWCKVPVSPWRPLSEEVLRCARRKGSPALRRASLQNQAYASSLLLDSCFSPLPSISNAQVPAMCSASADSGFRRSLTTATFVFFQRRGGFERQPPFRGTERRGI